MDGGGKCINRLKLLLNGSIFRFNGLGGLKRKKAQLALRLFDLLKCFYQIFL